MSGYKLAIDRSRLTILFFCLLPVMAHAQSAPEKNAVDTLTLSAASLTLRLSHPFIIENSDTLIAISSGARLTRGIEYVIDYRYGIVQFDSVAAIRHFNKEEGEEFVIVSIYRYLPFRFQDRYVRRSLVPVPSSEEDTLRIATPQTEFDLDDIFGTDLQKSGSIVRGITVGSNRDFSVNSGLRLQLAGKIATDVEVAASLTDENTPIQPEGTTQTLQEFDKVFVELRGTNFDVVLGDFNIDFEGTRLARLSRKLQGAKGTVELGSRTSTRGTATVSGAVPRGKFHTNQFQGMEGVQGPYRLSGRNGEREIIIVPGTEKIFINGDLMVRGETNDYTIDYSLSELTFTTRRLITGASRIVVDFEYSDRQYGRSFIAAQGGAGLFGDKLSLGVSFFREGDDRDDPIDFTLSDSSRQILEQAGDDREKAVIGGVTVVDSNGFYVRVDTVTAGGPTFFYRYAPGPDARYVVSFSYVGEGKGEYVSKEAGIFQWEGPGLGNYLPIRFLPVPQLQNVVDYALTARPLPDLYLSGEFAQSIFDANTFSSLDDDDNNGHAFDLRADYRPRETRLFGNRIGGFDLALRERFLNENFTPIDRINEIEFTRKWGVDSLRSADEQTEEASLHYLPIDGLSVGAGYGSFRRGTILRSVRKEANITAADSSLPAVQYFFEDIRSEDEVITQSSTWIRHNGKAEYMIWRVTPTFRFENENRSLGSLSDGSTSPGSFRFDLTAPGIRVIGPGPLEFSTEFEWRRDDLFDAVGGAVRRESNSFTQAYQVLLRGLSDLSSSLDITIRNKDVTPVFELQGSEDVKSVLVRNQTRYAPGSRWFDVAGFYEASTQQSAVLQRVFVKVTAGTGNYRYLGDLNNNGLADENEFELTRYDGDFVAVTVPTESFAPVIDLKTSLRLNLRPSNLLSGERGTIAAVISTLSTETYYRIDERSTEPDLEEIYLLHLSRFLNDSTTITGSQLFTQDLNIFERDPSFSTRLRFLERKSLARFSGGVEKGYVREQSVRILSQLLREVSQQFDFIRRLDRGTAESGSSRNRDILMDTFIFDLSYRPEQNLELGFKVELASGTDRFPTEPIDADINSQTLRLTYSFQGLGQARTEVAREEVNTSGTEAMIPFELTSGRVVGKTWLWRASFDYRVARFIQTTVSYDGRSEPGNRVVHTGRAEVQAFF